MYQRTAYKGFSLTEVLLAVAVFTVGMVFIGGVFPVAVWFSERSAERTMGAVAANEAFATIQLTGKHWDGILREVSEANEIKVVYYDDHEDKNSDYRFVCRQFADAFPWPSSIISQNLEIPVSIPFEHALNQLRMRQIDPNNDVLWELEDVNELMFAYPSVGEWGKKQYWWSAICNRVGARELLVTVFVAREKASGKEYYRRNPDAVNELLKDGTRPVVMYMQVEPGNALDEVFVNNLTGEREEKFVSDGSILVDDLTGQIYRVVERVALRESARPVLRLDRNWDNEGEYKRMNDFAGTNALPYVWVVSPPVEGGKAACVGVYQTVVKF